MNTQEPLALDESIHDAIRADVQALGGTKKVAKVLWPTKDDVTGQARLRACVSHNHDQELGPDEIEMLIEHTALVHSFHIVNYYARKARGQFVRVEPRTRVERLMEKVEQMQSNFAQTCAELQTAVADLRESERAERVRAVK